MTSLPAVDDLPLLGMPPEIPQGDLANFVTRFLLQRAPVAAPVHHARQAAVLVPIVCHPMRPTLLLTRRSALLRKHAGQVAFPGGAADATDATLIATALREADEEVSIAPDLVTVLGTLPPIDSVSGFQVTPVVGLLPANTPFRPSADEVAELFEMPLQTAFSLARYHPLDIERQQRKHRVYLSWYQQQFVWGLTAAIIRQLAIQVSSPSV